VVEGDVEFAAGVVFKGDVVVKASGGHFITETN